MSQLHFDPDSVQRSATILRDTQQSWGQFLRTRQTAIPTQLLGEGLASYSGQLTAALDALQRSRAAASENMAEFAQGLHRFGAKAHHVDQDAASDLQRVDGVLGSGSSL